MRDNFFEQPTLHPLLIYITQQDDRQRHCEAEGRGNPGRFIKDLEKTMTAIEFENISKLYRLGLVSTGTLSPLPVPNTISQEKFSRQMYTSLF